MADTDFTVRDVLEWARTKPAEQRYNYVDPKNCALCQFLRETGRAAAPIVCSNMWAERPGFPSTRFDDAIRAAANNNDESFGGLVERLEKLCPETPVTKSDWARLDAYMADIELASA